MAGWLKPSARSPLWRHPWIANPGLSKPSSTLKGPQTKTHRAISIENPLKGTNTGFASTARLLALPQCPRRERILAGCCCCRTARVRGSCATCVAMGQDLYEDFCTAAFVNKRIRMSQQERKAGQFVSLMALREKCFSLGVQLLEHQCDNHH